MEPNTSYNYHPVDIANWFLCHIDRDAGDSITHLKLQKLLYYAQAWTMVLKGKSLFEADFEAWAHGPVLPEIYETYKQFGWEALPMCECDDVVSENVEEILHEVNRIYGGKTAKYLEELTHLEDPWIAARGGIAPELRCSTVISKGNMIRYYKSVLSDE